ncbi:pyridoxal-dependent decarboxylase, exosortase A system-associated [Devosia sp. YIM 151766]|uniref:pyridoxal-dependent decarboxylase, exosortase A system-associated n=1 Tax=Devosia sp. YIM 151766 TaxID=3017325 RepID=UPI00255D133A|nr:pyridoxal-dependent decarboxylase, exosortase A system-associated [Devosia sp. YIM 151766]WIY54224.1 pyridoxal-dependent decarboxylase, exosortase A system-associated [Devosia sp. YIM 151766]
MSMHPAIENFAVRDNCLLVGGIPVDRLAERVGSTPFFAYDRALIAARVARLRNMLPPMVRLAYAVKANPMPALIHHLSGLVDGFDVASVHEMHLALNAGTPASEISFAGPGKTDAELSCAVAAGVTIELESSSEARRAAEIGTRLGIRPRVAVRINPDFVVRGSGMRMGGGAQQFGVDAEQVPALVTFIGEAGLDLIGFHIFAGSQNLQAEVIAEAQRQSLELIASLAPLCPMPIRYVNLGGGFGIPYFERDRPLDLAHVGKNLADLIDTVAARQMPEAQVTVELGRYIVGEAGIYVSRVIDRKVSRGKIYIVVDGGMHHQLAASGNLGQAIRRNYPIAVGNRMAGPMMERVNVVGCLCTPLDLLGDDVALNDPGVGDLVVLFQSGAYGLTASPTAFLGHPAPRECLV